MDQAAAPVAVRGVEVAKLDALKPHPRNYRSHPDEQLDHLTASLREHGVYRNVVVSRDGTVLAGAGVVEAARRIGITDLRSSSSARCAR